MQALRQNDPEKRQRPAGKRDAKLEDDRRPEPNPLKRGRATQWRSDMLTVIEGGLLKHERECKEARLEADPAQHNAHVKDFKNQPWYFEKFFLPTIKR